MLGWWRNHRRGMQMDGAFRVEGIAVMAGKLFPRHESSISDSIRHIIMMRCCQHADTPAWLHAVPNDGYNEGHMDAVQCGMFSWFRCWMQWAALPVSCAAAHRKRDSDRSWIIISSQTKQIMGSIWYVRKCPRMNRADWVPNGMRNDEAKHRASRIEKPCHAWMYWRVSVVMTWPRGMRGMGWCWQHARDEICAATMIEVSFGGTCRAGTCRCRPPRVHARMV